MPGVLSPENLQSSVQQCIEQGPILLPASALFSWLAHTCKYIFRQKTMSWSGLDDGKMTTTVNTW
jgi:hypothetical protein